jgi:hypothetical protein
MSDSQNDAELRGSGSSHGYHYLNLFQCCQWKFHLRYNLLLVPRLLSRFLIFGQVIHLVAEAFYKELPTARDCDGLVSLFLFELARRKDLYSKADAYDEDIERGPVMLRKWYDTFAARDFEENIILAVEETMVFTLPGGYEMTVKPDVVMQRRESGLIYAHEHKTTSRSASEMAKRVTLEMQADAQILGVNAWLKDGDLSAHECSGVVPDILYKRQSVCTATRDTVVTRTRRELADAQLCFAGIFADIASKRSALDRGVVPELLYSHNGAWCGNFDCEYAPICHAHYTSIPPNFLKASEGVEDEV